MQRFAQLCDHKLKAVEDATELPMSVPTLERERFAYCKYWLANALMIHTCRTELVLEGFCNVSHAVNWSVGINHDIST